MSEKKPSFRRVQETPASTVEATPVKATVDPSTVEAPLPVVDPSTVEAAPKPTVKLTQEKIKPVLTKTFMGTEKSERFSKKGSVKRASGTVLAPQSGGLSFVICPANLSGKPNHKIMNVFDKKWISVKREYKGWYSERVGFKLGEIKQNSVQSDVWVIKCLYQDADSVFQQNALDECVKKLVKLATYEKASIHFDKLVLEETPEWRDKFEEMVNAGLVVYTYE